MAEIINLNRLKKARDKVAASALAAENRVKFGRSKAEKNADISSVKALRHHVESHKRDDGTDA